MLTERFIPVADNCSLTQQQRDEEGKFFRKVAEQGHYAGRTKPTGTRQGMYACDANGDLLASINATRAERVLEMLNEALDKWERTRPEAEVPGDYKKDRRFNRAFPTGALVLRQTMRDIPRKESLGEHDTWRHNFDHLWILKEEAESLIPADPKPGAEIMMPRELVRRIAQFHLVDHVRGSGTPWREGHIRRAEIALRVEFVDEESIQMRLDGSALLKAPPTGQRNPYNNFKVDMERGIDALIKGVVRYNRKSGVFERFDMAAVGSRWGAAVYNFRLNDLGPAPIGFAFELVPSEPRNQTPPRFLLGDYMRRDRS